MPTYGFSVEKIRPRKNTLRANFLLSLDGIKVIARLRYYPAAGGVHHDGYSPPWSVATALPLIFSLPVKVL